MPVSPSEVQFPLKWGEIKIVTQAFKIIDEALLMGDRVVELNREEAELNDTCVDYILNTYRLKKWDVQLVVPSTMKHIRFHFKL